MVPGDDDGQQLRSSLMATGRSPRQAPTFDFVGLATTMRAAAQNIRSQAERRYRDDLVRADSLDAAAGQLAQLIEATADAESPRAPARRRPPAKGGRPEKKRSPAAPTTTKSSMTAKRQPSGITDRAVALMTRSPRRTWTAGEVAVALNAEPASVSTLLAAAARDGKLRRVGRGAYQADRPR